MGRHEIGPPRRAQSKVLPTPVSDAPTRPSARAARPHPGTDRSHCVAGAAVGPEQLVRRPSNGGWSVGHVLEHLCVTSELYEPPIRQLLQSARPDAAAALRPWKPTLVGKLTVNMFERPCACRRRSAWRPRHRHEAVLSRASSRISALSPAARRSDRLRLATPAHVVTRGVLPLRFNLGDVFSILVVHAERHARQMERVVAETS